MTATRDDIQRWIKDAKDGGAAFLIIMHDTYDHDNYPVSVKPGDNPREIGKKRSENMQVVEECYNLSKPIAAQLNLRRCFDYGDY